MATPLVASLLETHPNDVTLPGRERPALWSPWWAWAEESAGGPAWLELVGYCTRPHARADVNDAHDRRTSPVDELHCHFPAPLRSLIDAVRTLQLDRGPTADNASVGSSGPAYRMSPKKQHEVERMAAYIHRLVCAESPRSVWHAVDVGSGQGYLSRALQELGFDVLALDNDAHQTSGADRWPAEKAARRAKRQQGDAGAQTLDTGGTRRGSLTHRTVHVCPRTLDDAIDDWLRERPGSDQPVPVLMVALHACGSLTIDVLRTFLSERARGPRPERAWRPHSLVVVGCCYNLMSPSDFPLSKRLRELDPIPKLPIAARHLAAQVPSQWLKDEDALQSAELALRKVVYRALLQSVLQATALQLHAIPVTLSEGPIQPGLGETLENRRLGKLNNKAYKDWPTFLERATSKLGIDLATISSPLPSWFVHEAARLRMESALMVLQTLRCILGPMIESLILLDRRDWIRDVLAEMSDSGQEVEVEMVNLFDQATGSGRNVALIIKRATTPPPVIERV